MKRFQCLFVLGGLTLFAAPQLVAQEIVHALCGTVSSINPSHSSITVFQDAGSQATFKVMSSSNTRIAFDKKIAGEVTSAKEFQKQGAYVVLFYFGEDENRTAVALKTLGQGPFSSTTGEVTDWNSHDHKLSVRDQAGAIHSFKIDAQTIAETYMGAVNGSKFDLNKGDHVRLVSSLKDAVQTALFIREK